MLLRWGCEMADNDKLSCFVMASPSGVCFYSEFGFEAMGEVSRAWYFYQYVSGTKMMDRCLSLIPLLTLDTLLYSECYILYFWLHGLSPHTSIAGEVTTSSR
jgi:hypothetical protein